MKSLSKALTLTALLVGGAAYAVAQNAGKPNPKEPAGSETTNPPGGKPNAPPAASTPSTPSNEPGVGSRPIGPPAGTNKDSKDFMDKQDKQKGG